MTKSIMMLSEPHEVLARIGLFEGISEANRGALSRICIPKRVKKGEIIFSEGNKGFAAYILVSGSIQLYKTTSGGRWVVIKHVRQGEMFGEVVLFEENTYPVSAKALRESLLYLVPKHQFLCLLEERGFRNDFLRSIMRKLRYLSEKIKYLAAYDVEQRLLWFLAEQYGQHERITISLTKKQVAAAIGITPETLSRVLLRMRKAGLLVWNGREVRVAEKAWNSLCRS